MGVVICLVVAVGIILVVAFFAYFTRVIGRLEEDNGHLDEVASGVLKYRVPVGVDPAMVAVNLHHQGYQVTTRYDYGQTYLYIRTVTGNAQEREIIRGLVLNADEVEYQKFGPPPWVWRPESVRFEDEPAPDDHRDDRTVD
jgi:hypothetical protein